MVYFNDYLLPILFNLLLMIKIYFNKFLKRQTKAMEGLIDLEIAGEIDRKFFLAFLKGLTQIKFKNQLKKVQQA